MSVTRWLARTMHTHLGQHLKNPGLGWAHLLTAKPSNQLGMAAALLWQGLQRGKIRLCRGQVRVQQIGAMRQPDGRPILCGVASYRAFALTSGPVTDARVVTDSGEVLATGMPSFVGQKNGLNRWAINLWFDSGRLSLQDQKLWVQVRHKGQVLAKARRFVHPISPEDLPLPEAELAATTTAYIPSPPPEMREAVDAWVLSRPLLVTLPEENRLLVQPPASILLLRTDQLGDVSASVPAMMALRQAWPDAKITVVCQPGVVPFLRASGVADRFLPVVYIYDHTTEQRSLAPGEKEALTAALANQSFDLAMDLSPGQESQPLLAKVQARYRISFNPDQNPHVDFGVDLRSRDKVSGKSVISHAAHVRLLVESLLLAQNQQQPVIRRITHGSPQDLARLGALGPEEGLEPRGYVIFHTGARHRLNRWPLAHYFTLAHALYAKTSLPVRLFVDKDDLPEAQSLQLSHPLPSGCEVQGQLEMEDFDLLLSNAALLVCNDSGPKHLAALRGTPVLSIAVARLESREWGQNQAGRIIVRQVPCAGCGVNKIALCGKNSACLYHIEVKDVLQVALEILNSSVSSS